MTKNQRQFPGLYERHLTESITWTLYKHWAMNYLAGEGLTGEGGNRSGGVQMVRHDAVEWAMCDVPRVVFARLYESPLGELSAVYSYPNGIGLTDHYFWELYGSALMLDGPERFDTEQEMEARVIELLGQ